MQSFERIPAWRKLGLQLKRPASEISQDTIPPIQAEKKPKKVKTATKESINWSEHVTTATTGRLEGAKPVNTTLSISKSIPNKVTQPTKSTASEETSNLKKSTNSKTAVTENATLQSRAGPSTKAKQRRSVTFAEDTKAETDAKDELDTTEVDAVDEEIALAKRRALKRQKKEEKQKKKAEQLQLHGPTTSNATNLSYLDNFLNNKEAWKFNKSHQTQILKDLFNIYRIPPTHHVELGAYIFGLQGSAARSRVREAAQKIIDETNGTQSSIESELSGEALNKMDSPEARREAAHASFRADLAKVKKRFDEWFKAKEQSTIEGRYKLLQRDRATMILRALNSGADSQPATSVQTNGQDQQIHDLGPSDTTKTRRRRGTRGKKRRTGVPDDDDDSGADEDPVAILRQPDLESDPHSSQDEDDMENSDIEGDDDDAEEGEETSESEDGSDSDDANPESEGDKK